MWAVIAHGYTEENDVQSTFSGTRLEVKIEKDKNFSIPNLIWRKFLI